ncbi:MAG: 1-acyl-sn-glycerol-3-phosphate acyltransferase [Kofleriaceae bacterium]|nr:1-acyl-sn-glycerol-3-phosphate acyltransferase [Kofleriaceae bacterium]
MAYRFITWLLRLAARVFFRQIEVVGDEHIPADAPVLFVGNHPNSLIDPILIITSCRRKVHFAAKDTLFSTRMMRFILTRLGAVPVARKDDHGAPAHGGKIDNDAAFTAMFEVLQRNGAIGIFPEGLSHDESQLARLKTGAARMALGGAQHTQLPVQIVPCGLTFIHPKRFRSRVLVQYGTPIIVDDAWRSKHATDEKIAVRELTESIETALRRLTINAPDWDTVRALDVVRRLYQPDEISIEQRVELARRFNTYFAQVQDHPRVSATMQRVAAYQQRLDELGITDRELAHDLSKIEIGARVAKHLSLIGIWLPLTVPGAPMHLLTVIFARMFGAKLTPRKDVIATTKLLIGMALVGLSYAGVVGLLAWRGSWRWALLAGMLLPLSGWATLRVLDRVRLVRRGLSTLLRQLRFRHEVQALRNERAALVHEVVDVVTSVTPTGVTPLFPKHDPRRVDDEELHSAARSNADLDAEFDRDAANTSDSDGTNQVKS